MLLRLSRPIDKIIDDITMYRLLMYYLIGLLAVAVGLSVIGDLHYNPAYIAISASILVMACWTLNRIFAYFFHVPVNPESPILTGLILALIVPPTISFSSILFLLAAAGLAMGSKYILTIHNKHIFNPAAIAVVLTAFGPHQNANWWVGTAVMLPFILLGGIVIVRKIRREYMVYGFFIATTAATIAYSLSAGTSVSSGLRNMILSSAVFFLGFVMLTEPYTSPATRFRQIIYAVIVGILLPPQAHLGSFYTSPEIALVIGNIFAYIASPKARLIPKLQAKLAIASNTLEFAFSPEGKIAYRPGQYMEWTLPHTKTDSRGSRRYFTLASSPTEKTLKLGIKFYEGGSSYKTAMLDMNANCQVVAAQVAGDFLMPRDTSKKLTFLAGGIGITPFRSMVKYLTDTGEHRNVKLIYAAQTEADFAYKEIFERARTTLGIQTLYVVEDTSATLPSRYTLPGFITADLIRQTMPDFLEREFYISGTHAMVEAMQTMLLELGVGKQAVKIDFFPGYV